MTSYGIPLRDNRVTAIDKADGTLTQGFNWKLFGNGYVAATRGEMMLYLHRLIAGAGTRELVDHIDMDPLNNRTSNLRIATKSQNGANRPDRGADRRRVNGTSLFKGVSWRKHRDCWVAYVHSMGVTKNLGCYEYENDAARAYNQGALEAWGEFARLNDVPDGGGRRNVSDSL